MFVFRSLVVGLLAACAILTAQAARRPPIVIAAPAAPVLTPENRATIIDVAPGVSDVIPLIGLAPGEHVVAVQDTPVLTDLAAGAAIREVGQGRHRYVDVTTTQRRVIVLMH